MNELSLRAFNTLYPISDAYPDCVRLHWATDRCLLRDKLKRRTHCEVVAQKAPVCGI